jgi:hypothetical protein
MTLTESQLKRQILDYLRHKRIFCWNEPNTGLYDKKSGAWRNNQSIKGKPDIIGFFDKGWGTYSGRFFCVEVKKDGRQKEKSGGLSIHQQEFAQAVILAGGVWIVAYKVEDVEERLDLINGGRNA